MSLEIEVHASDGRLYSGPAEVLEASSSDHDWRIEFTLPANEVAQFQMRRGERVQIRPLNASARPSALIYDFRFEDSAGFSGFSGTGVIQLAGSGPRPVSPN
jgi:hypothetical protein